MDNLDSEAVKVQSEEGVVRDMYPNEIANESVQVRAAYQEGLFDGVIVSALVGYLLFIVGTTIALYRG
jgi:hypothetical protein